MYVKRYGHPETAAGWHFLTGQQPAINALASAVGFGYARVPGPDGHLSQFAHASAIQILTPEGKLAQYYMGVEYAPKDLQLGLVEASHNKIGSPVDNILTYCYRYDPEQNKHSLVVARIVQLGGVLTMLGLGSFMVVNFRRDLKQEEIPRRDWRA
jgi:protein SCO1/2